MLLLLFFYTNILIPVDENGLLMLYYSLNNFLSDTLFLVVLKHYIILEVVFLYFVSPIYCNITGLHAGGDIACQNVGGGICAGNTVSCGNVVGDVNSGSDIYCGNVVGNVSTGNEITCGNISGSVNANNNVHCGDISECGKISCTTLRVKGGIECDSIECSGDIHTEEKINDIK